MVSTNVYKGFLNRSTVRGCERTASNGGCSFAVCQVRTNARTIFTKVSLDRMDIGYSCRGDCRLACQSDIKCPSVRGGVERTVVFLLRLSQILKNFRGFYLILLFFYYTIRYRSIYLTRMYGASRFLQSVIAAWLE